MSTRDMNQTSFLEDRYVLFRNSDKFLLWFPDFSTKLRTKMFLKTNGSFVCTCHEFYLLLYYGNFQQYFCFSMVVSFIDDRN